MIETSTSFVCFGDTQFLPGYCVLLPKREVGSLNELTLSERRDFLTDMSLVGDAILSATDSFRVNYDILGNTDAFLHAHIFPRYHWENDKRLKKPVWLYDESHWLDEKYAYNEADHGEIRMAITNILEGNSISCTSK